MKKNKQGKRKKRLLRIMIQPTSSSTQREPIYDAAQEKKEKKKRAYDAHKPSNYNSIIHDLEFTIFYTNRT